MYDICIIGGGASGMTAAIAAHQKNESAAICIIEKNDILGRKILATGNGRCNLSNEGCENKDDTLDFLKRLGIYTRTDEEGRIYPYSEQASQVRAILADHARAACSRIILGQSVSSVEKKDDVFVVKTEGGETVEAQQLIIASGGKAAPQHGTTGDGYAFAKALGHTVTKLGPALTGVETEDDLSPLKGVRAKCEAYLFEGMDNIWREPGEVQFTEDGLSGICIFNMVAMIRLRPGETYREAMHRYEIGIDLIPDFDEEEFIALLKQREQIEDIKKESRRLLATFVNDKIADFVIEKSGTEAHELAAALKYSRFKVRSVKGWKDAQCTVGGVPYDEVDSETMKSLKTEGLYIAGEIMDYDGPCGGFNLQHAWETGIKAGKAAAADITRADD